MTKSQFDSLIALIESPEEIGNWQCDEYTAHHNSGIYIWIAIGGPYPWRPVEIRMSYLGQRKWRLAKAIRTLKGNILQSKTERKLDELERLYRL